MLTKDGFWPKYVRDRVHSTYGILGPSCVITAIAAVVLFRTPRVMEIVTCYGWMSMLGTFAVMIATGALALSIDYTPEIGSKQLFWALYCAVQSAVIAPMCVMGSPILTRAAVYTGGIVGVFSIMAALAPSGKFLYMGGPLAVGFALLLISSLASIWLPPITVLGAGLLSISLYGGLILFSGFLLYDTQRFIQRAETPAATYFDPANASFSIYMDTLNIFIRIAILLAGGGDLCRIRFDLME